MTTLNAGWRLHFGSKHQRVLGLRTQGTAFLPRGLPTPHLILRSRRAGHRHRSSLGRLLVFPQVQGK